MIYLYFDGLSIEELTLDELIEIRERIASTNKVLASYIDRFIESKGKDKKGEENSRGEITITIIKEEEGRVGEEEEEEEVKAESAKTIKVETA